MVRKDAKVGTIVTIAVGLIIAILTSIFSPVFSPLSDSIKELISGEPNTTIISAMTFNGSNDNMGKIVNHTFPVVASNSITFTFNASQTPPIGAPTHLLGFQCSFDGTPFEDCESPKSYYNIQTEAGHNFQVRAKGILGNVDRTAAGFYFTTLTSANIQGIVKTNNSIGNVSFTLDDKPHQINSTTDSFGQFYLPGISQGMHKFVVYFSDGPRREYFFVPAGKDMMTILFDGRNMTASIQPPTNKTFHDNENKYNFAYVIAQSNNNKSNVFDSAALSNTSINTIGTGPSASVNKQGIIGNISLFQTSEKSSNTQNPFSTRIWINTTDAILSNIDKVTYYLHPTFNPPVVTSYTKENKFQISFSNWGKFNIFATVNFKDDSKLNLVLPSEKWKDM